MIYKINIAEEFSKTPGGRYIKDGEYSGEKFFRYLLLPKYIKLTVNDELEINLDDSYGYSIGFLDESFGRLSKIFAPKNILNKITFISYEEPGLIREIKEIVESYLP
jgi:hypothetical protein